MLPHFKFLSNILLLRTKNKNKIRKKIAGGLKREVWKINPILAEKFSDPRFSGQVYAEVTGTRSGGTEGLFFLIADMKGYNSTPSSILT